MRVLVTGGAGFLGLNFVNHVLRKTRHDIVVLDRMSYSTAEPSLASLPSPRVRVVRGDVCDAPLVEALVNESDAVVHYAAETHNDTSLEDPGRFVHSNLVGTFTILEAVRRHGKRLHHISSDEVFGDLSFSDPRRFTEGTAYNPSSPYSATKAGSDHLVRAWIRSFGIEATISNCSNSYGPFQHIEKFIPRQITNVLTGRRPRVYGEGANVRDWIHAEDHSSAVMAILERGRPGETYLIGANSEISNREVVERILSAFGQPSDAFDLVADRAGHDRRYAIDSSKLRQELDWAPRYGDFDEGLRQTISWYRDNEAWWSPEKRAVEDWYAGRGQ